MAFLMVFNLRKKALAPLSDIILPDPGVAEPLYGANQPMVDMQWESSGQYNFMTQAEMVDAYGGVDAMREQMNTFKENPDESRELIDSVEMIKQMSKKPFNLKKAQMPAAPGAVAPEPVVPKFKRVEEFRIWADSNPTFTVLQALGGQAGDHLKEAMEQYYSLKDEGEKAMMAAQIFSDKDFPLREEQVFMGQEKTIGSVNEIIQKLAQKTTNKNKKKAFNIKKQAQHKSLDNAILWGPGQSRIDPFLHQPVSDWHIVERNKGFGLVVDDIWNIDYETIWRENIMDKYSRPYRDKDGEWVGGYIQKRFEVDKNIPETSNYQLKPGQKRKPILPEYGNTESRLQAARAAGDIAGASDTSKPFNWKEASKKKS